MFGSRWSELSKAVGWSAPAFPLPYPSLEEVQKASQDGDTFKLLHWFRFLPPPETEQQGELLAIIIAAVEMFRKELEKEQ